jgi:hypothetical protein
LRATIPVNPAHPATFPSSRRSPASCAPSAPATPHLRDKPRPTRAGCGRPKGRSRGEKTGMAVETKTSAYDGNGAASPQWWPSRYGPEDLIGAGNERMPERTLAALKLPQQGRSIKLAQLLTEDVPAFPPRFRNQTVLGHGALEATRLGAGGTDTSYFEEQVTQDIHEYEEVEPGASWGAAQLVHRAACLARRRRQLGLRGHPLRARERDLRGPSTCWPRRARTSWRTSRPRSWPTAATRSSSSA